MEAAYQGSFAVPVAGVNPDEFGYSLGVHCQLPNGNLLMVGHSQFQNVREVVPPSILDGRQATVVGPWRYIFSGDPAWKAGGMLADGSLIRWTRYNGYNGTGADEPSQGQWDGSVASGPWQTAFHDSFCNGYMCPAPPALQAMGYTYLAGQSNTSGAAINRYGPNLFAVQSNPGGTHQAGTLIHHPDNARRYVGPGHDWWIADQISSMVWIDTPTKHGVLAFGYRGLSGFGYKCDVATDPYNGCGGFSASSYEAFLWIYDDQHMLDVLAGTRDAWSLQPVEKKLLTFGNGPVTYYTMFGGNPASHYKCSLSGDKLIVSVAGAFAASPYSATPICYQFQF
jgi:hypothetical protein